MDQTHESPRTDTTSLNEQNSTNDVAYYVGIDLGSNNTVVSSCHVSNPGILTVEANDLANRSTPSVVGFNRNIRNVGEAAEAELTSNPSNTIPNLVELIGIDSEEKFQGALERHQYGWRFGRLFEQGADGLSHLTIPVKFDEERYLMTPEHLISMILRRACLSVLVNHEGKGCLSATEACSLLQKLSVCVAVPSRYSVNEGRSILKAAKLAGIHHVALVPQWTALVQQWASSNLPEYHRTHFCRLLSAEAAAGASTQNVYAAILDVGYSQTTLVLLHLYANQSAQGAETVPQPEPLDPLGLEVVATATDDAMGCNEFTKALASHVLERIKSQSPTTQDLWSFEPNTKKAYRFFQACEKLMRDLSALPDSTIDIEAFGDSGDIHVPVTREAFEDACSRYKKRLQNLLTTWATECRAKRPDCVSRISGIDISGGGTRIPWVQETALQAMNNMFPKFSAEGPRGEEGSTTTVCEEMTVRRSMDGSSAVASGAAQAAAQLATTGGSALLSHSVLQVGSLSDVEEQTAAQADLELRLSNIEQTELRRLGVRNQLEAYILEMQAIVGDSANRELVDVEKAKSIVDAADDWFCNPPTSDPITYDEYEEILRRLQNDLEEPCKMYFAKREQDKQAFDEDLRKNAADVAAQGRDEDPDTKLTAGQSIKRALKNKNEGSELFKGGSTELAAMRYVRALQYTANLKDASPQQQEEGKAISLSCNLNLAQCYLKIGNETTLKKTVSCCNTALELDGENVKALYRKGLALQKLKDYNEAAKTMNLCLAVDPENRDAHRVLEEIAKNINDENVKTRKMYARMFAKPGWP